MSERPLVLHKDPYTGEEKWLPGLFADEQALVDAAQRAYHADVDAINAKRAALTKEGYAASTLYLERVNGVYLRAGLEPPRVYA